MPKLDRITLEVVPDAGTEAQQLKGGHVDGIILGLAFNQLSDLEQSGIEVLKSPSTLNTFIMLNCRTVLLGNGQISNSLMPNGALYWNPDQKGYAFELDQAQSVMRDSSVPHGFSLQFDVDLGDQQALQTATLIKNMWAKINVKVEINQFTSTDDVVNVYLGQFQAYPTGWTNDTIDPDELVSYAILPRPDGSFYTGWTNQQANDLANQGRATLDPNKRRQIYYQIQQIHMESAPFVYLYGAPYLDALSRKIKGYFRHPTGQWVFKNMYVQS